MDLPTGSLVRQLRGPHMASSDRSQVDYAQALAADHGWHVFPVSERKTPMWKKDSEFGEGSLNATTDAELIERMWRPCPNARIGLRLDFSGLMAVDVDQHEPIDGAASLRRMVDVFGTLPVTCVQRSMSGKGFHFLFDSPPHEIRKNINQFPGIDFLFHHYIVLHRWNTGRSPWEIKVQPLPRVWLELLKDRPRKVRKTGPTTNGDPLREIEPSQYVHDLAGLVPNARGFVQCPAHEDWRPSLKVYDTAEQGWYCYQCERGGSIYDFAALIAGLPKDWGEDQRTAVAVIESVYSRYELIFDVRSEHER